MRIGNVVWTGVALLSLSAGAAGAQTVQKCVSREGNARFQSAPCARGERTAEVWDATPETEGANPRTTRSGATRRTRRTAEPRRVADARAAVQTGDACADARAYRDLAERRAGLSRNYDLLSTLQRRVFEACR